MNHDVAGGAADLVPSAGSDFPIEELAPLEQRFSTPVAHQKGLSRFKLEGLPHPTPGLPYSDPPQRRAQAFVFRAPRGFLMHNGTAATNGQQHREKSTSGKAPRVQHWAEDSRLPSVPSSILPHTKSHYLLSYHLTCLRFSLLKCKMGLSEVKSYCKELTCFCENFVNCKHL